MFDLLEFILLYCRPTTKGHNWQFCQNWVTTITRFRVTKSIRRNYKTPYFRLINPKNISSKMSFMYKSMGAKHSNWQLSQNNQSVSYALLSWGGGSIPFWVYIPFWPLWPPVGWYPPSNTSASGTLLYPTSPMIFNLICEVRIRCMQYSWVISSQAGASLKKTLRIRRDNTI